VIPIGPLVVHVLLAAPRDERGDDQRAACPPGARLVEGDHYEAVQHECVLEKDGYCAAYRPGVARVSGGRTRVRVCMDEFEAPNQRGAKPIVMLSSVEAAAYCRAHGEKRLCTENEWETACEGPDLRPWPYGFRYDPEACNGAKRWMKFDAYALMRGGDAAQAETDRLWQGEGSGARASCVAASGVYDLTGNVEEWIASSRARQWPTALIGGFWAKWWPQCRGTNAAHEPTFRFYEVGFRCCMDPR
jgi:formylglycine-generating enzyme required for sulfatase activity